MGVSYWEFDHSPTESHGDDGTFIAKRRLGCAWGDRYTLLNEMSSGPTSLYPYNNLGAYAVSATIIPFNDEPDKDQIASQMSYGTAVVTVTYAIASYYPQSISDRMMIEEMHPWIEYRSLPRSKMHIGSDTGDGPARDPRVLVSGMDYTLTSFGHTLVSANALNLMGYVNAAPWATLMLGVTFAEECLLYLGPAPKIAARMGLSPDLSIAQAWKFRNIPWTKDLTENGWEYVYNDAGDLLYPSGNFNWLIPSYLP